MYRGYKALKYAFEKRINDGVWKLSMVTFFYPGKTYSNRYTSNLKKRGTKNNI